MSSLLNKCLQKISREVGKGQLGSICDVETSKYNFRLGKPPSINIILD